MDRKKMLANFAARHRKKRRPRAEDGTVVNPHFWDNGIPSKIPGIGPATRKPRGYPN